MGSHEEKELKKLEKEQERYLNEKKRAARRFKSNLKAFGIGFGILLVIIVALYIISQPRVLPPGAYDSFAQCLSSNGAIMYGTSWCPHCKAQKEMFGNSFQYVNFVDCDNSPNACSAAGVEGYPTWVFANGSSVAGTQDLYSLGQESGCALE